MGSSSDNSFAWTDTSSDSFNSTSMAADDFDDKLDRNYDFNCDNGKKRKRKNYLNKTLLNNDPGDKECGVDIKEEKKKIIKLEPESDIDLSKKKKKIECMEMNGDRNQNDLQDSMSYDETYLNMKVKQEESAASNSTKLKQKKHKSQSSVDATATFKSTKKYTSNEISDGDLKQETKPDTEISKSKRKKKKSKRKYDSDDHIIEVEDKINIEETIINKTDNETLSKNIKVNHADSSMRENNTLLDESEGSVCNEISAIKCDNDHTITFSSTVMEEDKTKMYCDESFNEVTISRQHKRAKNSIAVQDSNKKSEAIKLRTQRISDRIRFEDDDDTNIESSQLVHESDYENSKISSKLNQFVGRNPNFKLISQDFKNKLSLTLDDQIWMLKCPQEIDIQDFNNTSLNIQGKCKIKVGGQTYDVSAEEEKSDTISILTIEQSKYQIRNLPLSGVIHLRKRIPKAHFRDDNIMVNNQTNFIPLPETKCRHPLFGSNYKKALKIPAAIAERLNMQDDEKSLMKTEKRRKKKNKKDRNTSKPTDIQTDHILKSEPSMEISGKKKNKRRIVDDECPLPKKVKRIKHDPESAEAWESEKAIEENLFNF